MKSSKLVTTFFLAALTSAAACGSDETTSANPTTTALGSGGSGGTGGLGGSGGASTGAGGATINEGNGACEVALPDFHTAAYRCDAPDGSPALSGSHCCSAADCHVELYASPQAFCADLSCTEDDFTGTRCDANVGIPSTIGSWCCPSPDCHGVNEKAYGPCKINNP